jgi:hypothetical protein
MEINSEDIREPARSSALKLTRSKESQADQQDAPKPKQNDRSAAVKEVPIKHTQNIQIRGFGKDEDGNPFVRLRIWAGEKLNSIVLPLDRLQSPKSAGFGELNRLDAHLISDQAKRELINRLQAEGYHQSRFTVATRLGWRGHDFVLPDGIISQSDRPMYRWLDSERPERFDRYRTGGSYRAWRQGCRVIKRNSRLLLAATVALAGVVGPKLGTESIFVCLVGEGEAGRSAILAFAGSFWGCHTDTNMAHTLGFVLPWDSTEYDTEKLALASNHTVVLLDETRALTTDVSELVKFLTKQVYRLERDFEKGRGIAGHRRQSAHVSLLATSNVSIETAPANVKIDNAMRGRWIEVPTPRSGHGMFETLQGAPDLPKFVRRIQQLYVHHFGHAARKFIAQLSAWLARDEAGFLRWAEQRRDYFLQAAAKGIPSAAQAHRIRQKFATLYAVGCLAVEFGILPINKKQLLKALLTCLRDHFAHVERERQTTGQPSRSALELPREHIRAHPPLDLRDKLLPSINGFDLAQCPGLLLHHSTRGDEFCIANTKLEQIVKGKARAQQLKHDLDRTGDIATADGVGDARFSVKRTIAKPAPNHRHRPNVIAIKLSAINMVANESG